MTDRDTVSTNVGTTTNEATNPRDFIPFLSNNDEVTYTEDEKN
jgi:hypothetical protein